MHLNHLLSKFYGFLIIRIFLLVKLPWYTSKIFIIIKHCSEYFTPLKEKVKRYTFSVTITAMMICLVLAVILGIIVYRVAFLVVLSNSEQLRKWSASIIPVSAAIINLLAVLLLGQFYGWLAIKLTDMECHRTDSNYENSLTIKMCLFQFVNFYAAIFYIAFIKGR